MPWSLGGGECGLPDSLNASVQQSRVHTALHGHLHALCEEPGITVASTATLQGLLHALRSGHPRLASTGPRADDVSRVLYAMATIMDALNPLRNRASVAHPNIELLDNAEAMLVVNATRTILAYLDSKLRAEASEQAAP